MEAHAQASNPSALEFGAEGAPITLPFESVRSISSDALRPAGAPLTVAELNAGLVRLGSAANPALVPISSGVSSIHSAVAKVARFRPLGSLPSLLSSAWMLLDQQTGVRRAPRPVGSASCDKHALPAFDAFRR